VPGKERAIVALEERAAAPGLWDDAPAASALMQNLTALRSQIERWTALRDHVDELVELAEMAAGEGDGALQAELEGELSAVQAQFADLELQVLLSRPYADHSAVLAIHAGAGGTDSQDWAQMLLRMFLRWAERRGYRTEVLDSMEGEEAGLKSATVEIKGRDAYGYLQSERGVHRLVRLSPFDSAHRRHTSFALVEVLPALEGEAEVVVDPKDVKMDVYRATGAGGQNVNKTSTAVRLTHLPTGIVVTCQNERSQVQNREVAMRILQARLLERQLAEREREQAQLKGAHVEAEWGNQIRSYVLHPYSMVKDHRTGHETGNVQAVLDGDLDAFMEAYLHHNAELVPA
jgi:peptide chain release factor 2